MSVTQIELEGRFAGYGAGVSFSSRTSSGGTLVQMAKITADGEAAWNTTQSTQDAGLRFFTTKSGVVGEKARLTAGGNLLVGVTSASANGGVLQLKSGITFPGTAVSSTDSNTLDDYEEGTFTPVYRSGSPTGTAFTLSGGTQYSRYIKIGKLVLVNFGFVDTNVSGSTGVLYITGFPFNLWSNGSNNNRSMGGTIAYINGWNTAGEIISYSENNYMIPLSQGDTVWTVVNYTPANASYLHISFVYEAET